MHYSTHKWVEVLEWRVVLSVAKLTPGQERYYERSVAAGLDDYYAGRGESPGVWTGRGARALELEGVVQGGELGRLIRGLHPQTEKQLRARRQSRARVITIERIDPLTDERRIETKKLAPVAGFDLVFSPPRASACSTPSATSRRAALSTRPISTAWQAALGYLEDEACVTRRGAQGVHREHAPGFVAAAYQHRTSRAQDPHLHTHVIVANMAQSPSDGKWRTLDGEPILKSYRLAAGYLYQAQLRAELTRALGVEWDEPRKGMAELKHVPRTVIREFSTRRAQVVEELARGGQGGLLRRPGRCARDPRTQRARRPDQTARGLARAGCRARIRRPRAASGFSAGSPTRSRRAKSCCASQAGCSARRVSPRSRPRSPALRP